MRAARRQRFAASSDDARMQHVRRALVYAAPLMWPHAPVWWRCGLAVSLALLPPGVGDDPPPAGSARPRSTAETFPGNFGELHV